MSSLEFPKLLTPKEVAKKLSISEGTLAQWRFHRRYPLRYVKLGGHIRYYEPDLLAFIEKQTRAK